jgi:hypothetical protein
MNTNYFIKMINSYNFLSYFKRFNLPKSHPNPHHFIQYISTPQFISSVFFSVHCYFFYHQIFYLFSCSFLFLFLFFNYQINILGNYHLIDFVFFYYFFYVIFNFIIIFKFFIAFIYLNPSITFILLQILIHFIYHLIPDYFLYIIITDANHYILVLLYNIIIIITIIITIVNIHIPFFIINHNLIHEYYQNNFYFTIHYYYIYYYRIAVYYFNCNLIFTILIIIFQIISVDFRFAIHIGKSDFRVLKVFLILKIYNSLFCSRSHLLIRFISPQQIGDIKLVYRHCAHIKVSLFFHSYFLFFHRLGEYFSTD